MAKLSNIEIAYQYLQKEKNGADFNSVWNVVAGEIQASNNNKNKLIADLYSDMVLDNRFALTPDGKWALRSNMSAEDVKKQYDYVDAFDYDADFDDIDDDIEVKDEEEIEEEDEEDEDDSFGLNAEDSYDDIDS